MTPPSSFSRTQSISIRQATSPQDLDSIIECFRAYTKWLNLDLTLQDYATEVSTLPGKYTPPGGALLLARDVAEAQEALGCIAMRPIELQPDFVRPAGRRPEARYCELKRLYVYPAARGRNVARALVAGALRIARDQGYDEALLDTVDSMTAAISLYRSMGFEEVERYYPNPTTGFINMSKKVQSPPQQERLKI